MGGKVSVPVILPTLLWPCTRGQAEVRIEAETLRSCVERLVEEYPLLKVHLFDENDKLRHHVHMFWNDENLNWLDDWNVAAKPGDELTILQAVSGG